MATVTEPTAEVKPKPHTYKCSLKNCGIEEPDASLVLCWRKEWAEWGVVRSFRVVCLSEPFDEGYSCFRADLYHFIPRRSETGADKEWMDDLGFLDDPEDFISDLVDSKLFVSGTSSCSPFVQPRKESVLARWR